MGWHIGTSGPDAGPYAQCAGLSQMLIFSITANAEHVGSRYKWTCMLKIGVIILNLIIIKSQELASHYLNLILIKHMVV